MSGHVIFLLLALISFGIDAFHTWILPNVKINFTALGFALVVAAVLIT